MKRIPALSLIVALSFSASAFAQTNEKKPVDSNAPHGMTMKNKDMDSCMQMKGMDGMDMKGMDMKNMDPKTCQDMMNKMKKSKSASHTNVHEVDGVVKEVDQAGKVTLQHGPVKSLGWPAMSMGFAVKDKTLMDRLTIGSKVHVEFSKQGDDYVITSVK